MTDQEMFEAMAKLWIALGGDAVGFGYSISAIHDRIRELEPEESEE